MATVNASALRPLGASRAWGFNAVLLGNTGERSKSLDSPSQWRFSERRHGCIVDGGLPPRKSNFSPPKSLENQFSGPSAADAALSFWDATGGP